MQKRSKNIQNQSNNKRSPIIIYAATMEERILSERNQQNRKARVTSADALLHIYLLCAVDIKISIFISNPFSYLVSILKSVSHCGLAEIIFNDESVYLSNS